MLWKTWEGDGLELLRLTINSGSVLAEGAVIRVGSEGPFEVRYQVRCDQGWRMREVSVIETTGEREVELSTDGEGNWSADGFMVPALDGCVDVDISITPFTNTLPIRRLDLGVGEYEDIDVAYVDATGMKVERARQRYTCLSLGEEGGLYRYEAPDSGFTADLPVDADGLMLDYPEAFCRVSPVAR